MCSLIRPVLLCLILTIVASSSTTAHAATEQKLAPVAKANCLKAAAECLRACRECLVSGDMPCCKKCAEACQKCQATCKAMAT